MRFLELCAGVGDFSLGLEWAGMTCVGQVEIAPFCNAVLEKHWPHVPRWKDVKDESSYSEFPAVDLICGGYPCQPFSRAGKRRGADDDRHLWPYVFRICQRLRPAWCLFENVAGHVSMGLDDVLSDLEGEGYAAVSLVIPACAVGAWHRRDRVWIVAHSDGARELQPQGRQQEQRGRVDNLLEIAADVDSERCKEPDFSAVATESGCDNRERIFGTCSEISPFKPRMVRSVHGISGDAHRVKALGNAVVPQEVCEIGRAIVAAHYGGGYVHA